MMKYSRLETQISTLSSAMVNLRNRQRGDRRRTMYYLHAAYRKIHNHGPHMTTLHTPYNLDSRNLESSRTRRTRVNFSKRSPRRSTIRATTTKAQRPALRRVRWRTCYILPIIISIAGITRRRFSSRSSIIKLLLFLITRIRCSISSCLRIFVCLLGNRIVTGRGRRT